MGAQGRAQRQARWAAAIEYEPRDQLVASVKTGSFRLRTDSFLRISHLQQVGDVASDPMNVGDHFPDTPPRLRIALIQHFEGSRCQ